MLITLFVSVIIINWGKKSVIKQSNSINERSLNIKGGQSSSDVWGYEKLEKDKRNEELSQTEQQIEDVELTICTEFVSFASNVFWVDIPEELGNVVALYEVCWFSLASY